ncbi:bifunctional diaminohydroxyphosphoribosylaminopyrimidine deaminase/5-amino-6-(5-phosphoribosylamino)uracil reductase RibD [Angustibacter luteus]|uniref:Riboflavin biosynthesis protein RibD n=1 Tax=Angustibacter luteus TaxID=658456 RepID=A0ABW1J9D8_9ACTN
MSDIDVAMARALLLARRGPSSDPNPRVGCVVLDDAGEVVGEGWHEGAGSPHAEVAALARAGTAAHGGTAVVTLEPCGHTGRTGPCTAALITAGVARVVFARPDANPDAAGGAQRLRAAGIHVSQIEDLGLRTEADALVARWQQAQDLGRPVVTWKFASTLDGRGAAADGTSQWITGAPARQDVHDLRADADTILVGTGTAWTDDPRLTVRDRRGADRPQQPRRAVMGLRGLRPGSVLERTGATVLDTRCPHEALRRLWALGSRHVWLEGGATLAAVFWQARLVDHVVAYVAPAFLGLGAPAVADLGIGSIDAIARLRLDDVTRLGDDLRLMLTPTPDPTEGA